jgi:hypothetical protein
MKKWLGEFLNKIRYNKSRRSDIYIANIARDKTGKWVTDNEGKLVYKNDDPKRIEKFTLLQEKKSKNLIVKCCDGDCQCKPEVEVKKATPKTVKIGTKDGVKTVSGKPVAKKKNTGGGSAKPPVAK